MRELAKQAECNFYLYDIAEGLRSAEDRRLRCISQESLKDPFFVLKWLEKNGRGFVAFLNINPLLEEDKKLCRAFKNIINEIIEKSLYLKLFIISPFSKIPDELQLDTFFIDLPFPSKIEIDQIIDSLLSSLNMDVNPTVKGQFVTALQGMREIDIINAIKYCIADGELDESDLSSIHYLKHQVIRKESLLEFINTSEGLEVVGGLKRLKEWLTTKGKVIKHLNEAINFGLDIPKGILLFGMPGCGKSLVAKTVAHEWKLPLFRLDMGMILGPYVGQSEENIRKAIKIAEAVAPCILWIDELEKAFAGISQEGSGEVIKRIFGSFLTWMQEKKKPVFVVATANDISNMPPEFLRKGRFDEIFYVDFPDLEARKEIIKIHLKKRGKNSWISEVENYAEKMEGYAGADIEAIIVELIEKAFIYKLENRKFNIKEELEKILAEFKPLSISLKNKIKEMKDKLKDFNAKPAN